MNKYGFIAKMRAHAGKRDELLAILLEAAQGMLSVPGCQLYIAGKDAKDENLIIIMEIWDSKETHDDSLKNEDAKALIAKAMPLLDGMPEGNSMEISGGKGI